jgi:hypothetical protein
VYHHGLSKVILAIDTKRSAAIRYVLNNYSVAAALLRCCTVTASFSIAIYRSATGNFVSSAYLQ